MNKSFFKLLLSATFILTGFLFFGAENASAACTVTEAKFRATSGGQVVQNIPPTGWYTDTNPPYVYIDFKTTGCENAPDNKFRFSIMELDSNSNLIVNLSNDSITGFNFREVIVPSNDFTVVTRAGDDECDSWSNPDCEYYIKITPSANNLSYIAGGFTSFNLTSNLRYNCHNGCGTFWQWIGIIPYGQISENDTPAENTEPGQSGPGVAGQTWDIDIQNPIGPSSMTLVDFIQKVIDFALTIGIPIIAIAIIYAGLLFVTARGNDQQLETAKNAFTYAVIGGAILLGSFIFARLIKDTIETIAMISNYFG